MIVRGLLLALGVSYLVVEKSIPAPNLVRVLLLISRDTVHPVGEIKLTQILGTLFSEFCPQSLSFASNPRVIQWVIGSTPVEHPDKFGHSKSTEDM